MSAESESGGESRTVKARVSDPDLLTALRAAESESSMAEVVRSSLRSELLDDDESGDVEPDVPDVARRGLRGMREHTGSASLLEVETAESVVANYCNIPKETVRRTVFQPLRQEGIIGVSPRLHAAYIDLDPSEVEE